jgi:hypothetical protein
MNTPLELHPAWGLLKSTFDDPAQGLGQPPPRNTALRLSKTPFSGNPSGTGSWWSSQRVGVFHITFTESLEGHRNFIIEVHLHDLCFMKKLRLQRAL